MGPSTSPKMLFLACAGLLLATPARGERDGALPIAREAEKQVLDVLVGRLGMALEVLGVPLSEKENDALARASRDTDPARSTGGIQRILDPKCLVGVVIEQDGTVKVLPGPASAELVENGWRQVLVKVYNRAGVAAPLRVRATSGEDSWLHARMFSDHPLPKELTGAAVEYRILQLESRLAGKRSATLDFEAGAPSESIGLSKGLALSFTTLKRATVTFQVRDENNNPSIAALEIRDGGGQVFPSQASRTPPDFTFHPQVYRADGGTVDLPAGSYTIVCSRGPEYLPITRNIMVGAGPQTVVFNLQRWIDPSLSGWWSGDHHIHAAGCAHFITPTQGVLPQDMAWHCRGEDLKIGGSLNWGPGFSYQQQFFTGQEDASSQYPYLIRQDVEVSGFGSHQSGHLCLLKLQQQIYPGATGSTGWPTLGLNTLRFGQAQGAVCGPAHSGWGLDVPGTTLPIYQIPPYNGIGANEYIVDVTHMVPGPAGSTVPAVDFMSAGDTPYTWELNMWYHTLNCGFRTRISGETDFPCIYGERVGLGRAYVKVSGTLTYDAWCDGIEKGRAYVCDGRSHFLDFTVGGVSFGDPNTQVNVSAPAQLPVTAQVAAYLPVTPNPAISGLPYNQKPYWHLERARIGSTRDVTVELIQNGSPVASQVITADGSVRNLAFTVDVARSSWVAMRIMGAAHTNPIFVILNGQPVRGSLRSAQWCRTGVDTCWTQKQGFIAAAETTDATTAYGFARSAYDQVIAESQRATAGNGATTAQDPGAQGIVSIEAEAATGNTAQGTHSWVEIAEGAAAGGTAMQALPNNGTQINTNYAAQSPRLDFAIDFVATGTHYVWVRGRADTAADDTVHAGLDGAETATAAAITGAGAGFAWLNTTQAGPRATVNVTSTGRHTINVWMAKDGFVFDRLVLTTDPAFVPAGTGPALSAQVFPGGGSSGGGGGCGTSGLEVLFFLSVLAAVRARRQSFSHSPRILR